MVLISCFGERFGLVWVMLEIDELLCCDPASERIINSYISHYFVRYRVLEKSILPFWTLKILGHFDELCHAYAYPGHKQDQQL